MAWEFEVDQQVICINDNFDMLGYAGEILPKKDVIYTIRNLEMYHDKLCCRLYEIKNKELLYGKDFCECLFICHAHFRPLQKTDISEFEKLLNKKYTDDDLSSGKDDGEYLPIKVKELEPA